MTGRFGWNNLLRVEVKVLKSRSKGLRIQTRPDWCRRGLKVMLKKLFFLLK